MFCRYCGKEIKENAEFCTRCGKPVKKTVPPARVTSSTERSSPKTMKREGHSEGTTEDLKEYSTEKTIQKSGKEPDVHKSRNLWIIFGVLCVVAVFLIVGMVLLVCSGLGDTADDATTEEKNLTTEQVSTQEDTQIVSTETTEAITTEAATTQEQVVENNGYYLRDNSTSGYKIYVPEGFYRVSEDDC